jgi:hypothetical protein
MASASDTAAAAAASSKCAEQLDGSRVGPVEVVQHEDERAGVCELLEQCPHRAVAAVALVLERHGSAVCHRGERRQDVRELCPHVGVERGEPIEVEALHVLVQRMYEHRKRQFALELGGRPREDEIPL